MQRTRVRGRFRFIVEPPRELGHLIKTVEYLYEIRKTDIRVSHLYPFWFFGGRKKKKGIDSAANETLVGAAVSHRNAIYRTFLTPPGWLVVRVIHLSLGGR